MTRDPMKFEVGLDSFGEVATEGGRALSDAETIRLLIEEAQLAESAGLDVFSVGEHYREGHTDAATPVLLAAIAASTTRIKLGTAVTVLSTNDPVRLYQSFATVDAVSNGRTEIVLGRGSSKESFPLFGYDLAEYEELFDERLELFMRLQREEQVTWSGRYRPALVDERVHPRMPVGGIPTWIGVGGSPASVMRAAEYGLPLLMAIIGGRPERFASNVELYERALKQFGHPQLPIGQHAVGLVAETDAEARELWWTYWQPLVEELQRERGFYAPTRERYESELVEGALYVGSPEVVAQKIARTARALHLSRFDLKYDIRHLPRTARAQTIELLGREVAPRVRELLAADSSEFEREGASS
ncbi:LLM class flavin-dependent oxidoreductase [Rhodococcus sp. 06-156-3C]|nr:LLM class flavin-dependent oxidoreductase [Rhodococcus sp. 06-156-4]OZD11348.1 LLM class flavin-dependent oxidoreductase [Rhodococcus sp. 06-156-3C]OZD13583.1 LLM class flavin-dependent oxidoreductase [Rhodococcus sp. 06-156-4a]OZD22078.1 LLM class flavin-dependent oxidoreductase [Rhodococcus sp. 06-156-4C]OZD30206.1 LLM class flavin-dependent oxidoreductase [Rhodococcus sp. 06-156-3]OZD37614.1 LLM class flavin-dependent oxidoreductase [Rhodococcus sp. 06-156-3b]